MVGQVWMKADVEQKSRPITSRSLILSGNQSFPEFPEGFSKKVNAFGGDTRSNGQPSSTPKDRFRLRTISPKGYCPGGLSTG